MSAIDSILICFGCIALIPVVLLFVETFKRFGLWRASLTIAALAGFIATALVSIQIFGIWVVMLFPFLLFVGLVLFKKSNRS